MSPLPLTDPHHMVIKPFLLLGLAAKYRSQKTKKSLFESPFGGLRGNVRTPSIARWKARDRLYIRHNWFLNFFRYLLGGNLSEVGVSRRGLHSAQISEGRERRPPPAVGVRVAEWLPFRVVGLSTYLKCTIYICHNPRVWQTDGQTELRLPISPSHMLAR